MARITLRPNLSPRWPQTIAPSGRNRNEIPIVAKERICARPGLSLAIGAKNRGPSTSPAAWA